MNALGKGKYKQGSINWNVSLPNSHVVSSSPMWWYLEVGSLGSEKVLNGINDLKKETPCEDTARRWSSISREVDPHQTADLPVPWSWISQTSEVGEINFYHLSATQCGHIPVPLMLPFLQPSPPWKLPSEVTASSRQL